MIEEVAPLIMLTVMAAMVAAVYWANRKDAASLSEDPLLVKIGRLGVTMMGVFPFAAVVSIVLLLAWFVLDILWVG